MFEGAAQRFLTLLILVALGWMIYQKTQGKNVLENIKGKLGGGTTDFVKSDMLGKGKL